MHYIPWTLYLSSPCVTSIFRIEIDTMFQAYIADTKNVLNLLLTLS